MQDFNHESIQAYLNVSVKQLWMFERCRNLTSTSCVPKSPFTDVL